MASITARNKRLPPPSLPLPQGSIKTTAIIAATLQTKSGRVNHAIPVAGALDLPEADLPIDPYVLGCWLGDGTSTSGGFSSADEEIIDFIREAGWPVRKCIDNSGIRPYGWTIGTVVRKTSGHGKFANNFATALKSLGVLPNKHVPKTYLRASRSQRLSLLQGLMDTDGTVAKGSGSSLFCSTKKCLAEAVVELACSLGHKPNLREGVAKLNGRVIGPKWTVQWTPPERVFRLTRKAELQKLTVSRIRKFRYIVGCEKVPSVPVRCIKVAAGDGMFLCGPTMIPTHNTSAMLAAALQYVQVPGYTAVLVRRTFRDLDQDKGLISRSKEWLNGKAHWNSSKHRWTFPSGAVLSFAHLEDERALNFFQGGAWNFIGVDEITQLPPKHSNYLFSRLCRNVGVDIPSRLRAASNPGGIGHEFIKRKFVDPRTADAYFVQARIDDNPGVDKKDYLRNLAKITDPITLRQLRDGDWSAYSGGRFFRDWFRQFRIYTDSNRDLRIVLEGGDPRGYLASTCWTFIICDPAASEQDSADYTVIGVFCVTPGNELLVLDIYREQCGVERIIPEIVKKCVEYKPLWVGIEDVSFQVGILNQAKRHPQIPAVRGLSPEGKGKLVRNTPAIIRASEGQIYLPEPHEAKWIDEWISEHVLFTGIEDQDRYSDQVDCTGYAVICLDRMGLMAATCHSDEDYRPYMPYGVESRAPVERAPQAERRASFSVG